MRLASCLAGDHRGNLFKGKEGNMTSEGRNRLEEEVKARLRPEEAELIMTLADLYASAVGTEAVNAVLTKLKEDIGTPDW